MTQGSVRITFGGLGPTHTSTSPMGAGLFKRLVLVAQEAIPSELPKGFAEYLADRELKLAMKEFLAAQLAHWRSRGFEIQCVAKNRVPSNLGGTLMHHLRHRSGMDMGKAPPIHEGRRTASESVWLVAYPQKEKQESFFYKVTTIDRLLLEQILGEKKKAALEWILTPLQVCDTLWEDIIAYDSRDYLFFLGFHQSLFPLFMRVWHNGGYWRMREEVWSEPMKGAENTYLVFGKELPK